MTEVHSCSYFCDRTECIKAQRDELRERLAQPEKGPVALVVDGVLVKSELPEKYTGHLYTTPPQRERLAQPEQESFSPEAISATQAAWKMGYDAAKAEQPEQEPVACVQDLGEVKRKHLVYEKGMDWKDPLYTAPPQRKPLMDEEIMDNWLKVMWAVGDRNKLPIPEFARAVEAAHGIKGEA